MAPCIEQQAFDTEAFGRPFYRIKTFDRASLEREFVELAKHPSVVIDTKLRADKIDDAAILIALGFRKICTQIEFAHDLKGIAEAANGIEIRTRVNLPPDVIAAHAANFRFDRFSLDPALPRAGHDRLYSAWMRNSLSNGRHSVAVKGANFITFRDDGDAIKIDLTSVLDHGRGIGTALLASVLGEARRRTKKQVFVVTECENLPAVGLYMKAGFVPIMYYSVLHFVRP